jgi:mRNA interferase MazF
MTDEFTKDFDSWNRLKQKLDGLPRVPNFRAREIWWCSIGTNIGSEICGKGDTFSRPVLILKRTGPSAFLGFPLTSKLKERPDYHRITIKGEPGDVQLAGIRALDARRLRTRIEKLPGHVFSEVLSSFVKICSPES